MPAFNLISHFHISLAVYEYRVLVLRWVACPCLVVRSAVSPECKTKAYWTRRVALKNRSSCSWRCFGYVALYIQITYNTASPDDLFEVFDIHVTCSSYRESLCQPGLSVIIIIIIIIIIIVIIIIIIISPMYLHKMYQHRACIYSTLLPMTIQLIAQHSGNVMHGMCP